MFLTLNSTTAWFGFDLADGPIVVELSPNVLGFVDDAYYRYVTDLGLVGPDKGKGDFELVK